MNAQLVVLQEADKRLPPRPAALPHEMAEADGWCVLPFGAPGGSLGWHGNAMLARPGLRLIETSHIDLPGLEPRGAIRADLETEIGPLRVIGLHLGLIRRFRLLQLAAISRVLSRLGPMPTVLAGDFNDWGKGHAIEAQLHGFDLLPVAPSFPAARPVARLDRFALGPELRLLRAEAFDDRPARIASDHLPVWADLACA